MYLEYAKISSFECTFTLYQKLSTLLRSGVHALCTIDCERVQMHFVPKIVNIISIWCTCILYQRLWTLGRVQMHFVTKHVAISLIGSTSVSGDKQWFDASCRRAYDGKQTVYRAWCRARDADHWSQFELASVEAKRVCSVARESHNERTRNTLKPSRFT